MMYAVIRTGSKQYRVSPGDVITVEKLDIEEGGECQFDDVVLLHDGKSVVSNPKDLARVEVSGRVVVQGRSGKTIVFKYKPKKGYKRKKGHRQQLTRVQIDDIIISKAAARAKAQGSGKASAGDATQGESA